jgi:hypothetical protein
MAKSKVQEKSPRATSPLGVAIDEAIKSGLERPDAWAHVVESGVKCSVNEFRSLFRDAQHEANRKKRAK